MFKEFDPRYQGLELCSKRSKFIVNPTTQKPPKIPKASTPRYIGHGPTAIPTKPPIHIHKLLFDWIKATTLATPTTTYKETKSTTKASTKPKSRNLRRKKKQKKLRRQKRHNFNDDFKLPVILDVDEKFLDYEFNKIDEDSDHKNNETVVGDEDLIKGNETDINTEHQPKETKSWSSALKEYFLSFITDKLKVEVVTEGPFLNSLNNKKPTKFIGEVLSRPPFPIESPGLLAFNRLENTYATNDVANFINPILSFDFDTKLEEIEKKENPSLTKVKY